MKIDIRELTLENISIWPASVKALVIAFCCCVLFAIAYSLLLHARWADLKQAQQQETILKEQFEAKQQQAVNLTAYRQQLNNMQGTFAIMLQQLPNKTQVPGLLEDISKAGSANGLEFKAFKPMAEIPKSFYIELPIQISVLGDYHKFGQFVSELAALNRIVTVHDFTIQTVINPQTGQNTGLLSMDILAKTYRYAQEQVSK